ncbi:MAG: DUF4352 domain-containing protein [Dehalococcoidia bacterium]
MADVTDTERLLDELERLKTRGRITENEYAARRAAILAGTIQAPAPAKSSGGGGIFKWGVLGCLGMFAAVGILVFLVLVVLGLAVTNSRDTESDSGGDVHVALATGSSGEIAPERNGSKQQRVTILQIANDVSSVTPLLVPAAGKRWVGFEVLVENIGSKQVNSMDWTLRDSKDIEHDRRYFTGASGTEVDIGYNDLSPGGKKQGWVYFEIDADASVKWLRADPNPFLAYDLYFAAQ